MRLSFNRRVSGPAVAPIGSLDSLAWSPEGDVPADGPDEDFIDAE